jgi:hypothetical protein
MRCRVCQSRSFSCNAEGLLVCDECATQSQDTTLLEVNDADDAGLGTVATARTRRKRTRRSVAASEALASAPSAQPEGARATHTDAQLLEAFQCVLKAQVVALVRVFRCAPELHDTVGGLWSRYLVLRSNVGGAGQLLPAAHVGGAGASTDAGTGTTPAATSSQVPPIQLMLTVCFCIVGCFLRREPLLTVDFHRAILAGTLPYTQAVAAACMPPHLRGCRSLHER